MYFMYDRDDLAVLERAQELFEDASRSPGEKLERKLRSLVADERFLKAMFKPDTAKVPKETINAAIARIYDVASKRSAIATLAEAISDYGYMDMGRASATFLVSLVNLGMATIDEKATDLGREKDHDEVSDREYNRQMAKLDSYQEDLHRLLKYAKRIVRNKARDLAEISNLPRNICTSALFSVPGVEYVDTYKVGFYLKTVLSNIYGYVNIAPEEFDDFDEVRWREFFRAIFGKNRLPDVASLILLEGVERIQNYDNYRDVRACWDSITQFALKTLNGAPESIRDQMIQLYLKRLNKMLANHDVDLRVDLRMIDDFRFDKLAETVTKYKAKIDSIMKMARNLSNAKPESSPV